MLYSSSKGFLRFPKSSSEFLRGELKRKLKGNDRGMSSRELKRAKASYIKRAKEILRELKRAKEES